MRMMKIVMAAVGVTLGAAAAQAAGGTCATADGHAVEKATTKEQCEQAKGVWTEAKAAAAGTEKAQGTTDATNATDATKAAKPAPKK